MTLLSACKQDTTPASPAAPTSAAPAPAPTVSTPTAPAVLSSGSKPPVIPTAVKGPVDFNGDGKLDRYEVITTDRDNDGLGFVRELHFYTDGEDTPWYVSETAVLSTKHGGVMGDPLRGVNHTEKGIVYINHSGGSREKWGYSHTYRWQKGDFKLIGATVFTDTPCEKSDKMDYNLSTGKANYSLKTMDCTTSTTKPKTSESKLAFIRMTTPPSMKKYEIGTTEVQVPQMDISVYY